MFMVTVMKLPIYFDYAATTPVDTKVAEAMSECLAIEGNFGNPASRSHVLGWKAEEAVEASRKQVADFIGADVREIIWTSGATEANNLALKGVVEAAGDGEVHIITSKIEHKSVLDTCEYLEGRGVTVTYVSPSMNGCVSLDAIYAAITNKTRLISLMHANNETGAINDIATLGAYCRKRGILLHVDAAQTLGKIDLNVQAYNVDLLSMSAHKIYGPKGAGALYVRRHPDVKVVAQIHGGGHERGMRSGTLATHQIVGFAKALEVAATLQKPEADRLASMRENFISGLTSLEGVHINGGEGSHHLPGIINIGFDGIDGETLLLSLRNLALSSGSACTSATVEPSYVLTAMGVPTVLAHNALRFSFGRYTKTSDIELAVDKICSAVTAMRCT